MPQPRQGVASSRQSSWRAFGDGRGGATVAKAVQRAARNDMHAWRGWVAWVSPHGASVWDKEPSCSTCLTQNKIQLWRVRNPVSQLLAHGGRAHNLGWCLRTASQRCEGRQTPTRSSHQAARVLCAQWFHGELANAGAKICLETANDQSISQSFTLTKMPRAGFEPATFGLHVYYETNATADCATRTLLPCRQAGVNKCEHTAYSSAPLSPLLSPSPPLLSAVSAGASVSSFVVTSSSASGSKSLVIPHRGR